MITALLGLAVGLPSGLAIPLLQQPIFRATTIQQTTDDTPQQTNIVEIQKMPEEVTAEAQLLEHMQAGANQADQATQTLTQHFVSLQAKDVPVASDCTDALTAVQGH